MKITPEAVIQQRIRDEFLNKYCLDFHVPKLIIHSIPNGIPLNLPAKLMSKGLDLMTKTGMKKGVADLNIDGMFGRCVKVEVKTPTGHQSPEQIDYQKDIEALKGHYILVFSVEDFWIKITPYIGWLKGGELEC